MPGLQTLATIIHIIVSFFLIIVVLLQSGKGGMGAAFGGGGGSAVFGGRGAGSFLARVTSTMAIVFMLTSVGLSYMSSQQRSVVAPTKKPAAANTDNEGGMGAGATAGDTPTDETGAAPAPTEGDVAADVAEVPGTDAAPAGADAAAPADVPAPADAPAPAGDDGTE